MGTVIGLYAPLLDILYVYLWLVQGKKWNRTKNVWARKWCTGGEVVINLITKANIAGNSGYKIYFDNYFTSYNLLKLLSEKEICETDPARVNRLANCPLPKNKELSPPPPKKKESVPFVSFECVAVIKCKDNSLVRVTSNFHDCFIGTTNRCWKKEKVFYPQPSTVKLHKSFMGVD